MTEKSARVDPAVSKAVHYKTQPIARRKNQSAVYYAAYVTGMPLHDVRRNKTFWRKDSQGDVLHWEIVGPQGADGWTLAELWNGAETAAKKINERPGRQTVIALPYELCQGDREGAERLARGHCLWLRDHYGIASTWALHAPNPEAYGESARNWHIHIVETDRRMSIDSAGRPVFGAKVRELTDGKQGKVELERRRADWQKRVNAELTRAGVATRVNMGRATQGEGPDYIPGLHRGPQVNAMLRKHQAAAREAMAAGISLPQPPQRLAALLAHAAARQTANTASRSFWEATGRALSQISQGAVELTGGTPRAATTPAPVLKGSTAPTAAEAGDLTQRGSPTARAPVSVLFEPSEGDIEPDAGQDLVREARAWERFWQDEARKAAAQRQRQR